MKILVSTPIFIICFQLKHFFPDSTLDKKVRKNKSGLAKQNILESLSNEELFRVENMNIFKRKQGKG